MIFGRFPVQMREGFGDFWPFFAVFGRFWPLLAVFGRFLPLITPQTLIRSVNPKLEHAPPNDIHQAHANWSEACSRAPGLATRREVKLEP